ncbi:hypothetical protein ACVMGC_000967 [Bradyrhizobium barranii subsp. barranii]|uniref:hypothetical protein n=1 Tax=Bradyrhizobium liaoningense TaxID=43992 RepID=UPI001BA747A3|nr:hypothetical protein [Bradyrhizobium liaoningense]MBR0883889.1 hypothetical protein [Bradyrhizobium liaoningense]
MKPKKNHFAGQKCRVRQSACTGCGKHLDGATVIDQKRAVPESGNITLCLYCGHLQAFADDLSLRELTDAEMHEVAGDERLIAVQRARALMLMERKR